MHHATTHAHIRAAMNEARSQRSGAFWSLFRRTRPSRHHPVQGSGLAPV